MVRSHLQCVSCCCSKQRRPGEPVSTWEELSLHLAPSSTASSAPVKFSRGRCSRNLRNFRLSVKLLRRRTERRTKRSRKAWRKCRRLFHWTCQTSPLHTITTPLCHTAVEFVWGCSGLVLFWTASVESVNLWQCNNYDVCEQATMHFFSSILSQFKLLTMFIRPWNLASSCHNFYSLVMMFELVWDVCMLASCWKISTKLTKLVVHVLINTILRHLVWMSSFRCNTFCLCGTVLDPVHISMHWCSLCWPVPVLTLLWTLHFLPLRVNQLVWSLISCCAFICHVPDRSSHSVQTLSFSSTTFFFCG